MLQVSPSEANLITTNWVKTISNMQTGRDGGGNRCLTFSLWIVPALSAKTFRWRTVEWLTLTFCLFFKTCGFNFVGACIILSKREDDRAGGRVAKYRASGRVLSHYTVKKSRVSQEYHTWAVSISVQIFVRIDFSFFWNPKPTLHTLKPEIYH